MHSTFKLTLAALAVSVVLTGCKSSQGPSVIADNPPKQITAPDSENGKKSTSPKPQSKQPNRPTTTVNTATDNANNQPVEPPAKPENTDPEITFTQPGVDLDSKNKPFRVVNLNPRKSVVNTSAFQKVNHDSFTADSVTDSPFESSDDDKDYNHILAFNLGNADQEIPFKTLDDKGGQNLGIHRGTYKDEKIEGDSQAIHYLYVNQPYSSYGALFTNENDSHLFSVHLAAGQKGENTRGDAYAEYGVFNNEDKWNENLVGNATYKGQTIARVVRTEEGKQVASLPQFDGDVTLNLDLAENWEDSKLSGQINSKTLGKISLNETQITPSSTINSNLSFGEEATVEGNDSFEGEYHVEFTGPNLEDAVGGVELENEKLKYNAVFGATKSAN
ncbi:TPA: hypothetical protein ACK3JH_001073 [Mannheimia haemolytica]